MLEVQVSVVGGGVVDILVSRDQLAHTNRVVTGIRINRANHTSELNMWVMFGFVNNKTFFISS